MINKTTINILNKLSSIRSEYNNNRYQNKELYAEVCDILDNIIVEELKELEAHQLLTLKYDSNSLMLILDIEEELKRRFADDSQNNN